MGPTINSRRRDVASKIAPDGSLYYGYNWAYPSSNLSIWVAEPEPKTELPGDFDSNGILDVADIDDLLVRVASGESPSTYDLNNDTVVNTEDIRVWVIGLAGTWVGDANLDGAFNSGDLITALAAGTYEMDVDAGWESGDFDGSGRFDTGDLIFSLADGGYEQGLRAAAVSAVPEPTCSALLAIGVIGVCRLRQRR